MCGGGRPVVLVPTHLVQIARPQFAEHEVKRRGLEAAVLLSDAHNVHGAEVGGVDEALEGGHETRTCPQVVHLPTCAAVVRASARGLHM